MLTRSVANLQRFLVVIGLVSLYTASAAAQGNAPRDSADAAAAPAQTDIPSSLLVGRWSNAGFSGRAATAAPTRRLILRPSGRYVIFRRGEVNTRETFDGAVTDTTPAFVEETGRWRLRSGQAGVSLLCVRPDTPRLFLHDACAPYVYYADGRDARHAPRLWNTRRSIPTASVLYWKSDASPFDPYLVRDTLPETSYGPKLDLTLAVAPDSDRDASERSQTYFEFQAEKQASAATNNASPQYPEALRAAKVEGEVLAQFVVDTTARVDMSTFKALKPSHDLFTDAVTLAVTNMRFHPAEISGEQVRQLVQQPFAFSLDR